MSGLDGIAPMAEVERRRLADCEAAIVRGLDSIRRAGSALATIRDDRLYRETYPTFEAYCQSRWGMGKQYAYRLIDQSTVVSAIASAALGSSGPSESSNVGMSPMGHKPEPDDRHGPSASSNVGMGPTGPKPDVGVSPMGDIPDLDDFHAPWEPDITERTARAIKPVLSDVTEEIRSRVAAGADPVTTTYAVVEAKRAEVTQAKKQTKESPADAEELARLREQLAEEIENRIEIATLAEELQAQLEAYEQAQEGECEQALIAARREIAELRGQLRTMQVVRDDYMRQCGQLRKEVKMLRRKLGD